MVVLEIAGVDFGDFEKVNAIFDEGVTGDVKINGRVKHDDTDSSMRILVAYR